MTFPAELAFKADRSLTPTARRVYDYLFTILDFTEVRSVKALHHAERCGVDRSGFADALTQLTVRGYLVEHAPEVFNVRRFTLSWSVRSDLRDQAS